MSWAFFFTIQKFYFVMTCILMYFSLSQSDIFCCFIGHTLKGRLIKSDAI